MNHSTTLSVVIGSYAQSSQTGIYMGQFAAASGTLTLTATHSGISNPSFVIGHPNGRWLYAVSETREGQVWALQWDGETLQPLNYQTSGGDDPCHLQLDETGQWLAVANYSSGSVTVLPIRPDGSLGEMTSHVQHSGHGPQTQRQEKAHAHSTLFTPDNQGLLVADLGIDAVVRYAFAAATGHLSLQGQIVSRPGAGPRHMAFDRRGRILYVANELDNTVAVYHHAQGVLQAQQTIDTIPPGALANTVAHIQLSPDGERVYVSNRGHDSVAMFAAAADGQLTSLATLSCGGACPRHFTLSPDGRFLLVANQNSHNVAVLSTGDRPEKSGDTVGNLPIAQASCVQFIP